VKHKEQAVKSLNGQTCSKCKCANALRWQNRKHEIDYPQNIRSPKYKISWRCSPFTNSSFHHSHHHSYQ